jgi:broad-specificity NMP kinase
LKPEQVLESLETEFVINNKMPGRGWRNNKIITNVKVEVLPPISYTKKIQRQREIFRSFSEDGDEEIKNIELLNTK